MRYLNLLIFGLFLNSICDAQTVKKTNWSSDIDSLAKELPQKHYDFFTVKDKNTFITSLEKLKLTANDLTDFGVALRLQQIIAGFGDSHTRINYEQLMDNKKKLPFQLYWFKDGLYILQTTQDNIGILGSRILSVNGTPLKTIIDSLSTLVTADNKAILKMVIPELIPSIQILEYFGFIKGPKTEIELKDLTGKVRKYMIESAEMSLQNRRMYKPDSLALCFKNQKALFVDYYQAKDKICYLQYNKCWSKELEIRYRNGNNANELPSFKEFENRVFKTLDTKTVDKLVFDVRFNGGGNSSQGTEFIEKIARYSKKHVDLKLFVVIGRQTFSSAILNAMDFKRLTNAVFIGEETAGKPNHFGEVRTFQLPSSGIKVNYSTKYFKETDEEINTITPDIKSESGFSDFSHGVDPVYEWIREH